MTELMIKTQGELAQADIYDLYTNTLSPLTKVNYISSIKTFFGVDELSQITIQDIQAVTPDVANTWAHMELAKGNAKSTINRKLTAMHSFYDYLCRRNVGVMEYNPFSSKEGCIRFKNASKDYSDKRVLAPEEVQKMFKLAHKTGGVLGARDLLVLQLLATTGMRRAELCSIKIGDIGHASGKHFATITGKGDKRRMVVIANHIHELIKNYLHLRGVSLRDRELPLIISHSSNADPSKHVDTTTIYRIVKKYAGEAGLDADAISPHNMRHTFATTAYDTLGVHKDQLQALMGHASSSTTARYIHSVEMLKNSPAEELSELYKL